MHSSLFCLGCSCVASSLLYSLNVGQCIAKIQLFVSPVGLFQRMAYQNLLVLTSTLCDSFKGNAAVFGQEPGNENVSGLSRKALPLVA